MVKKSAGMGQEVCQLKVTLRGIRPSIRRRLLVSADTTLTRLHRALQIAMGWQDSHMHEFRVNGRAYSWPRFGADGAQCPYR
jgi:hypothetical protein